MVSREGGARPVEAGARQVAPHHHHGGGGAGGCGGLAPRVGPHGGRAGHRVRRAGDARGHGREAKGAADAQPLALILYII